MVDNDQELEEAGFCNGMMVSIGGLIQELKPMMTKKGQMMCFLTIEDLYGKIEVVVFPRVYETYRRYLKMDQPVIVKGKISYNEETSAVGAGGSDFSHWRPCRYIAERSCAGEEGDLFN